MRFLFANHIMAAAFASAVAANHDNLNTDNIDGCQFADPDWRTVDLNPEEGDCVYMENSSNLADPDHRVTTLAELEQAIGLALTLNTECDEENGNTSAVLFRMDECDKNNPLGDYNIRIRADGTIRVGCKNFTRKGAEQVIVSAKVAAKKGKVPSYHTEGGGDANLEHTVRTSDYTNTMLVIGGDTVESEDILKLAAIRERLLKSNGKKVAEPKPVKVEPFSIFPKVKAKAKPRKRKR